MYQAHNHDQAYVRKAKGSDLFSVILSGTTSATANTVTTIAHGLGVTPVGAEVLIGNVYVTAIDATNVSVGSAGVSQAYKIGVIKA